MSSIPPVYDSRNVPQASRRPDPKISASELREAILKGNIEKIKSILESNSHIVNSSIDGTSFFMLAVSVNNLAACDLLLKEGADPMSKDAKGNTSLHVAVTRDSKEMVKLFSGHRVLVNSKNNNGHTPLCLARNDQVAQILVRAGAPLADYAYLGGAQSTIESFSKDQSSSKGDNEVHVVKALQIRNAIFSTRFAIWPPLVNYLETINIIKELGTIISGYMRSPEDLTFKDRHTLYHLCKTEKVEVLS